MRFFSTLVTLALLLAAPASAQTLPAFDAVADQAEAAGASRAEATSLARAVAQALPPTDQQAKLTAGDAASDDQFGFSVAVSGETAVVGAFGDDDGGASSGSAYVFVRSGAAWTQQAKLTADDAAASNFFGSSVAVSGETAVVGAFGDGDAGSFSGSAYVFVRSGAAWTQQAKLTASDAAAFDQFGFSVAVSGETAVVGAFFDDDGGSDSGSAYVFVRSGAAWTQQAKLTASDAAEGDNFGRSVAVSGETAVVGASANDDAGSNSGSAYVFVRSGAAWTQQAKLTASDAAEGDNFGRSVAVSGETAVVGASANDDAGSNSGSAYVFVRSGAAWTQQAKLTASDAAEGDNFGTSVAVSGETAVVGANANDDAGSTSGSAYVFVRSGTAWTQQAKLTADDNAEGDNFGISVAVSGETAVVGAHLDDDGGSNSGSAYVYAELGLEAAPPALVSLGQTDATLFTGNLGQPAGILPLADGRILVAERPANRVSLITEGTATNPNGTRTNFVTGLNGPVGLARLPDGRIIVSEAGDNEVSVISDANGDPVTPTLFAGGLNLPEALIVTTDGDVLVTARTSGRVDLITEATPANPNGTRTAFVTIADPFSLLQLADGRILAGQFGPSQVTVISDAAGDAITPTPLVTDLVLVTSLTQLDDGRIVAAERESRIVSVNPDGSGLAVVRSGGIRGQGLATLPDGRVLVSVSPNAVLILSGTLEGFYTVAAPSTTEPVADFFEPVFTQGFPGGDTGAGQPNVFFYDEPDGGDLDQGFRAPTAGEALAAGEGVFHFLFQDADFDGDEDAAPYALPLTGAEPTLPFSFALTYTDAAPVGTDDNTGNGEPDDGWNLLGNPLRARLDWNATHDAGTTTNVEPTAYDYDPARNSFSTYNAATNTATGNLITRGLILEGHGFYVRTTDAGPVLTAPSGASARVAAGADGPAPHVSLVLDAQAADGRTVGTEAVVALLDGALLGRDAADAALFMPSGSPYVALASRLADGSEPDAAFVQMALPGPDALGAEVTVDLAIGAVGLSEATLTWTTTLPDGWAATLLDGSTEVALVRADPDDPFAEQPSYALSLSGVGPEVGSGRLSLRLSRAATDAASGPAEAEVSLMRPNPTSGRATVVVTTPGTERVRVSVYDALGRRVAVALDGPVTGRAEVSVGSGLAPGVYVVRVEGATFAESRPLTVVR